MENLDWIQAQIEALSLHYPRVSSELTELRYEVLSLQQEVDFATLLLESWSKPQEYPALVPASSDLREAISGVSQFSSKTLATFTVQGLLDSILDNSHNERTMQSAIATLRKARRRISVASKLYAAHLPPTIRQLSQDDLHSIDTVGTLESLLQEFIAQPFAIGARANPDELKLPQEGVAKGFHDGMESIGKCWIDATIQGDDTYRTLVGAEMTLIKQLWTRTIEMLQSSPLGWLDDRSAQAKQFMTIRDQIEQKLRDYLYREQTSRHSIVFVGAQSSGKSTLLNAIIGYDILPVGRFNRILLGIRDIPIGDKLENEKFLELTGKQQESLEVFNQKEFMLPDTAIGVDNIRRVLTWINDLVRYSAIFKVGYQGFLMKNWAVVRCRLTFLADGSDHGHFELIDIPGVTGDPSKDRWHDVAHQAMREASSLVAVVSAANINQGTWRDLPQLINTGSDLRATIVVATQIDLIAYDKTWEDTRKAVQKWFWGSDPGLYLECSAFDGVPLLRLQKMLESVNTKPSFKEIQSQIPSHAVSRVWGRDGAGRYQAQSLDKAREVVTEALSDTKLSKTLKSIREYLIGPEERRYYSQEAYGLALRTQSLLSTLELHMAVLGLAPRNPVEEIRQHSNLEKRALAIISSITLKQEGLRSHLSRDLTSAEETITTGLNASIDKALKDKSQATLPRDVPLRFESKADAEIFVKSIQDSIYGMLLALRDTTLASILESAQTILREAIEDDLSYFKAHGVSDPFIDLASRRHMQKPVERPNFEDATSFATSSTNEDQPLSRAEEFRRRQERLLDQWAGKLRGKPRTLDSISPFFRALLAAVAFVPFAFRVRTPESKPSASVDFDVESLRDAYRSALLRAWNDQISPDLPVMADETVEEVIAILDKSVKSVVASSAERLAKLQEYPPSDLETAVISGLVHNYCNFAAAVGALERLFELLTKHD
ncbi:hypothetical protein FRC17_010089 [Serendipita sp. 399]|nr:hypothetical protein FRC17_010089 [Serendipita sp. 399]